MLASADLTFFDFETRGRGLDLKAVGTPAYAASAEAIVCAFAVGEGSTQVWHAGGAVLDWNDAAPAALKRAFDDGTLMAAWNASFDSMIWNFSTLGFPFLEPERVIDPMVQAAVSNLPTDLESAARTLGCGGKQADGKTLIKLFSIAGAAPADHPEEWRRFLDYAQRDVEAMREVYRRTRPLPRAEWRQYWAFERINRRGVHIDTAFVERAAALAAEDAAAIGRRLAELTDGAVTTVNQRLRIATWLHDRLPDTAMREVLTTGAPADEDEGDEAEEIEFSLRRDRVARLLAMLEAKRANCGLRPDETKAFEAATLRLYGAGASPKKFARIAREQIGGIIRDQYRFAGAGQTGRMCVDATTLVDTPTGPRRIVDLRPGDLVITHRQRPRPVLSRVQKGRAMMFELSGPNGEHVVATLNHRILTRQGWRKIDECFAKGPAGSLTLRGGCEPLSFIARANDKNRARFRHDASHGFRDPEKRVVAGRISSSQIGQLIPQQSREAQPALRSALGSGADHASGPLREVEWRGVYLRTSGYRGAAIGAGDFARHDGGPPHRWRQDEQQPRQSGDCHVRGASTAASASTWSLVYLGEREVWDISVAGDASYLAQGLAHHNSGKGIQLQNLTRDTLGDAEAALVDAIADGCAHADLTVADPGDMPVTRKLALLVRPALIAGPGKVFVWSDWSAIEARVTPWLAASPEADEVLAIFRASDADPARPDIYTIAAADILGKGPEAVTKTERGIGKVACLALGFGGSVGALQNMALSYRIHLDDAEARRIVTAWREANSWAPAFWGGHRDGESFGLWGAALTAWEQPGQITTAGRLGFAYRDDYLGGSLFMALPSGRLLTYPRPKWRDAEILDKDGKPTGETRRELSFQRAHGRAKLWHGTLCENAVQATAADLLRAAVTRIETNPVYAFMPIRLHTHDEVLIEVDEGGAEEAKAILRREMLTLPDWAAGLPLQSEESVCRYYTKSKAGLQ